MTNPEDPQRWGQPQQPAENGPTYGQPPQEPTTGGVVSYNASAFDEDSAKSGAPTSQGNQPPTSGSFGAPDAGGPTSGQFTTGQYGAAPATGAHDAQYGAAPGTGSYATGYDNGQYGAAPATGNYDAQYGAAPATGAHEAQYGAPQYGVDSYGTAQYDGAQYGAPGAPAAPTSGGIPAQPGYGAQTAASPYDTGAPKKSASRKPLLFGIGGLALVALLVAGYFVFFKFGGIQNSKGEIKNAEAFLTETESKWKDELPTDGIEVSSKAACYYVLNDSDDITNQVACGPSRRASTPKGAVWDMYHFSVTGSGDSQQAVDATATDTSQSAPKSGSLVTADGDGPADDGLGLKEPPLPKAPSKVIYEAGSYEVSEKSLGKASEFTGSPSLVGPGAQLTLVSKQEATSATIDGKLMAPAEGEKFYVITVNGESGPITESATNSVQFTFDGDTIEVPGDPSSLGESAYLVSWPDGAKGTLEMVSSGHTQSLSLDDGARAEDKSTEMYYSGKTSIDTPLSAAAVLPDTPSAAGPVFKMDVKFTDGKLAPFLADQGWAPEGQLWLVLNFTDSATVVTPGTTYTKYKFDCLTSSVEGGSMFECKSQGSGVGRLIATVPADQRNFNLSLVMKLSITGDGVADTTVDFAPVATPIAFP